MSVHPHEYEIYAIWGVLREIHVEWEIIDSSRHDLPESWRDDYSRFRLWECSMSEQMRTAREKKSQLVAQTLADVYKRTLQLLNELLEYLKDIYDILFGMRQDKSENNNDQEMGPRDREETEPVSEIAELWLMVKDVVTSLLKAVALVRKYSGSYSVQDTIRRTMSQHKTPGDMPTYLRSLRQDYPKIEHKDWLSLRISNLIAHKQLWLSHSSHPERLSALDAHNAEGEEMVPSTLYFCTFEHCNAGFFSSKTSWANHERMRHRRQWHCPICLKGFNDQDVTAKHMSDEHSLGDDSVYDLIYAASPLTLIMRTSDCAFCDDIAAWDLSSSQGAGPLLEPSSTSSSLVSLDAYEDHVCRHMRLLARLDIDLSAPTDAEDLTLKKTVVPQMQTGTTTISSFSPQTPSTSSQASARRRSDLSNIYIGARHPANESPGRVSPGLSQLPSLRRKRPESKSEKPPGDSSSNSRDDPEYLSRESARETTRRQRALDEAILRRKEDLEAAENLSLNREVERARYRSFDPLHRLSISQDLPRDDLDSGYSSQPRQTSPPAPPRHGRPFQTRPRFASSSPLGAQTAHRQGNYGHATVHQYHYPDSPAASSRRPSDSIRERGREIIARERAKAAAENLPTVQASKEERITNPGGPPQKSGPKKDEEGSGVQEYESPFSAVEPLDDTIPDGLRWEPVFDYVDERISGREYDHLPEESSRQDIRRRRDSDSSRRRRDKDEFWR